ncbi:MAG: hypothetical protein AAFQ80_13265 [Cyanobacteria bacterium J06621_8]
MEVISKVSLDLIFCLIIGFITIQASQSASQNQEFTESLTQESVRISAENLK